ncbi:hypothetical protein, partial [Lichenibacterium minor]
RRAPPCAELRPPPSTPKLHQLRGRYLAALAPRELRVITSLGLREIALQRDVSGLPPLSPAPRAENRAQVTKVASEGWYTSTCSYPTTPDLAHAAAMAAWNAQVAERRRIKETLKSIRQIPRWEVLSRRTNRRLMRWVYRLTYMKPMTQAGLKAKAAAAVAIMKTGASDPWVAALHASISRDALRIISAEAEARAEADREADGELLALGRAWEASCRRDDRTHIALVEAEERYNAPTPPEVLFNKPGEAGKLGPYPGEHMPTGRYWYGARQTIDAFRRMALGGHPNVRRDEILQAYDAWIAAGAAERERSGLTIAREEVDASVAENAALRARICMLPARTPAGVDLKLRVVLWLHDGLSGLEDELSPEEVENPEFSASIALSLALDLARQRRGAVPSAESVQIASAA